ILGDDYYRFDYYRLWWPMQEYFNLNYNRVANTFADSTDNPNAAVYRQAMWDIWWERNYDRYGQAQCIDNRMQTCDQGLQACFSAARTECQTDNRYDLD